MTICLYCDRPTSADGPAGTRPSKEHVIPKSLGDFGRFNVATACMDCNHLKNNRTPPEMLALAAAAENQARRWRNMAIRVDRFIEARGLIAPWSNVEQETAA